MGDLELQIFADRLKELRLSKSMTQSQFVEGLGITASALSAYEKNQKNPSISVAMRISQKHCVSLDWLCGITDSESRMVTYSDIISECLKYKNPIFCIEKVQKDFNKTINDFITSCKHMNKLKADNMIDNELYDIWLEKELKKYNKSIVNPGDTEAQEIRQAVKAMYEKTNK